MVEFIRERLPEPQTYFEAQGLSLKGRGKWRTTRCEFHGGTDSMRIKVETGAWVCMNCGLRGGDVLGYHMAAHGLGFVEAARALGAYLDDSKPHKGPERPSKLSAHDAMEVVVLELLTVFAHISDIRRGVVPDDESWQRLVRTIGRIEALVMEYRT